MSELAFRRRVVRPRWFKVGLRQPLAIVGVTIALAWIVIAIFAPLIAPYGSLAQSFTPAQSPSLHHLFGTDELGRSGLPGEVSRHFFQRFGAAILISVIDGAVQGAVASQSRGGAVIYNPSASQDVMTEVLKSTVNIPPTIRKAQGDRIQVLVARDLDFRSVYELKAAAR